MVYGCVLQHLEQSDEHVGSLLTYMFANSFEQKSNIWDRSTKRDLTHVFLRCHILKVCSTQCFLCTENNRDTSSPARRCGEEATSLR